MAPTRPPRSNMSSSPMPSSSVKRKNPMRAPARPSRMVANHAWRSRPNSVRGRVSLDDPVIITCAISGALANRDQCPAIPYTPAEYAAEARRIADEGGVMIHIHARRPDGTPSHAVEDFRAITEAIRAEVGDGLIVNYSTGALGVPVQERVAYLRALRPEVGALNMGSMNYAKYSARRKEFVFQAVFENSFATIRALLGPMVAAGIRP